MLRNLTSAVKWQKKCIFGRRYAPLLTYPQCVLNKCHRKIELIIFYLKLCDLHPYFIVWLIIYTAGFNKTSCFHIDKVGVFLVLALGKKQEAFEKKLKFRSGSNQVTRYLNH